MIRPEEVLDHRFLIWETTIDGRLRCHEWATERTCAIQIPTQTPQLQQLLGRYRDAGWYLHSEMNEHGTLCQFTPIALIGPDDLNKQA